MSDRRMSGPQQVYESIDRSVGWSFEVGGLLGSCFSQTVKMSSGDQLEVVLASLTALSMKKRVQESAISCRGSDLMGEMVGKILR